MPDLEKDLRELFAEDARGARLTSVSRRAPRVRWSPILAAGLTVVMLVAAVFAGRLLGDRQSSVVSPPSPSATPSCGAPSRTPIAGPILAGQWLSVSLDSIEPTDARTNQVHWVLRLALAKDAPAPASVSVGAHFTISERTAVQVLGYEMREPDARALNETELITIEPCSALVLVVRSAGPLIDGTFPYAITLEKVGLPEGTTVSPRIEVTLACSNRILSCAPAAVGATPIPGPTPVPGVLNPDFGIIYNGVRTGYEPGSAPVVRREGDIAAPVAELAPSYFNQFRGAISPDGRRAVYFGQKQNEPLAWTLYLLDGARPAEKRTILTLPEEIPGNLVWAPDGSGIAYVAFDKGSSQGVKPTYSAIRTLDLPSGKVSEMARVRDGSSYSLVGWDRANGILAATIAPHADARYPDARMTYLVFSPSGTRSWPLEGGFAAYSMVGAPNARDVVATRCDGAPKGCSLWTWALADFDTRRDQGIESGLSLGLIGFRPGTNEIGLFVADIRPGSATNRIELWSTRDRRRIYDLGDKMPDAQFFRADGSALILSIALDEAVVVDLGTGKVSRLPLPTPQAPWEIGRLASSIRLR